MTATTSAPVTAINSRRDFTAESNILTPQCLTLTEGPGAAPRRDPAVWNPRSPTMTLPGYRNSLHWTRSLVNEWRAASPHHQHPNRPPQNEAKPSHHPGRYYAGSTGVMDPPACAAGTIA
jgi:hypothetical protein